MGPLCSKVILKHRRTNGTNERIPAGKGRVCLCLSVCPLSDLVWSGMSLSVCVCLCVYLSLSVSVCLSVSVFAKGVNVSRELQSAPATRRRMLPAASCLQAHMVTPSTTLMPPAAARVTRAVALPPTRGWRFPIPSRVVVLAPRAVIPAVATSELRRWCPAVPVGDCRCKQAEACLQHAGHRSSSAAVAGAIVQA